MHICLLAKNYGIQFPDGINIYSRHEKHIPVSGPHQKESTIISNFVKYKWNFSLRFRDIFSANTIKNKMLVRFLDRPI